MVAAMAAMFCNAAMAQKAEANNVFNAEAIDYSFKVNNHSVTRYLKLNEEQQEQMAYICDRFNEDLRKVGNSKAEKRSQRFAKSLAYNMSAAHQVLDNNQYRKYIAILNSSLKHKGLDMLLNNNDMAMAE